MSRSRRHFGQDAPPAGDVARPQPASTPAAPERRPQASVHVPLREYVRRGLDVLFVALNPPTQSANNGHWFSGEQSAFFKLLHLSGLITESVPKPTADEIVFGGTSVNFKGAAYGVTDLRPELVETDSGKVRVGDEHVERFIATVRANEPRIVCVIHGKVRTEFNRLVGRMSGVIAPVEVGQFTSPLAECGSRFICNHFPNGNAHTDAVKIDIFRMVFARL
jgi:G:T/U-mismatch repair DNA glycosylase